MTVDLELYSQTTSSSFFIFAPTFRGLFSPTNINQYGCDTNTGIRNEYNFCLNKNFFVYEPI